jgi:hypothetical protein
MAMAMGCKGSEYMTIVETGLRLVAISIHLSKSNRLFSTWVWVKCMFEDTFYYACLLLANLHRAVKIRGAECGIEAIMLGCVTSIGGFLFGYDTVGHFGPSHHAND